MNKLYKFYRTDVEWAHYDEYYGAVIAAKSRQSATMMFRKLTAVNSFTIQYLGKTNLKSSIILTDFNAG